MKQMIEAEWKVLVRRSSARGLLLVSALLPILTALMLGAISGSDLTFNGQPVSEVFSFSGPHTATLALRVRHALFLPIFILFVTGSSFATERANHMWRERLVRPASRDSMLMSKIVALLLLCGVSLVLNAVMSISLGTILMGTDGPWGMVLLGHMISLCTDLGLIALASLLSTMCRSGAMVVVSGILIYLSDQAVNAALFLVGMAGVDGTALVQQFLPSTGWNLWTMMLGDSGWSPALNLVVWTTLFLALARHRLNRTDIP